MVPLGHSEIKGVFLWRQLSRDIPDHTRACMERDLLMVSIRQDPWKQQIKVREFCRSKGVWDSSLWHCF